MEKVQRYRRKISPFGATVMDPVALLQKLGSSPVLEGEDQAIYDELFNTVRGDIAPTDIIECLWVRDVVDDTWWIFRWRRLATMIAPSMFNTATRLTSHTVWNEFRHGESRLSGIQEFSEFAQRAQCLERLISDALQRRNSTLREIERRRAMFALQLRNTIGKAKTQVLEQKLRNTNDA